MMRSTMSIFFFFLIDPAPPKISPLPLPAALPICASHQHGDVRPLPKSRLWFAFGLTGTFMVVEIIGGMVTGSLALISDAMHMLTDAMALLLALVAIRAGRKAADLLRTYGSARFEILAAAVNALVLLGVAFYILYEAYRRLSAPAEIQSLEIGR